MVKKGEPIIEVEGIDTRFGDHVIHENLSLTVKRGEVIGIVGGSGTGKSVLLRTILGLKKPDAGRVRVFGIDFSTLPEEERRLHEQRWGVLFQDGALFSALTVAENIQVPYREHLNLSQELMDELAAMKIAMVGLRDTAGDLYPSELSGGMAQRAALARSLARQPEILLLDEPFSALDEITRGDMQALLQTIIARHGTAAVLVTHDIDEAMILADRIVLIGDSPGRQIGEWTLESLRPRDPLGPELSALRIEIMKLLRAHRRASAPGASDAAPAERLPADAAA